MTREQKTQRWTVLFMSIATILFYLYGAWMFSGCASKEISTPEPYNCIEDGTGMQCEGPSNEEPSQGLEVRYEKIIERSPAVINETR